MNWNGAELISYIASPSLITVKVKGFVSLTIGTENATSGLTGNAWFLDFLALLEALAMIISKMQKLRIIGKQS